MAKRTKSRRDDSAVETASSVAADAAERAARQTRDAASEANDQARRLTSHLTSVMQCAPIVAGAAQSVSQEWLNYAQGALRRNVEGMSGLARCRTIRDLVDVQNDRFVQEMDEFVQSSRRASERMLGAAQEVAERIEGNIAGGD